jgi:hypothetical protein
MNKKIGWIMLFAGIFMLILGYTNVLAVLVVDNTPPQITYTVPANGQTVGSVNSFTMWANDGESGLASMSVTFYDPVGATIFTASKTCSGETGTVSWSQAVSPAITVSGSGYKAVYSAKNLAGLSSSVTAIFTIYTGLQGTWYINSQEITSTTQTIYSTSQAVTFKFVKTAGVEDSKISCTVWEGTSQLVTLTNSASGTWTGSYTFSLGKHQVDLKASDGTNTVTMSVVGLQVGEEFELPRFNMLQLFGWTLTGIGLALILIGKKQQ